MNPKLSVIVPAYNTPNILENILTLVKEVSNITHDYEIILVNDGSDDFPILMQSNYIKVITHEINKGKGEALVSGFREAKGDTVAFLDADLQIPATLLNPYYKIITGARNPDVLIGSKRHFNSKVEYPTSRRIMSWIYQSLNRAMFGLTVQDTQVGIKMFKKEVVNDILPNLSVKKFAIDLEILVAANERGYKTLEAPVKINESFSSTVNIKAVTQTIQDTIFIWYRKKFKNKYKGVSGRSPTIHLPLR